MYVCMCVCSKGSEEDAALDFDAVQRGDAEMENRMNRVIRACIDLMSVILLYRHDQGAGGSKIYNHMH